MAKASNVWKLIVLSIVISLVVLAVFTAVFITMIVPAYNITREQVYSVLSKALPILIGLVLIEIGLLIGKKNDVDNSANIDKLNPNAYDSWLYSNPVDDPMAKSDLGSDTSFALQKQPVQSVKEVVKEVPVEVVKEVIKESPVEVIKEVSVEIIKEVEKPIEVKVPVEVIKEVQVPVEVIKEVPVEVVKEVPVEIIKEVVKEVPVEIIKEVVKEVPIEVIKETPVEIVKEPVEEVVSEPTFYDFKHTLEEELATAAEENYPISLVGFGNVDQLNAKIERTLGRDTLYFTEDGVTFAILPFYRNNDADYATRLFANKRIATQEGKRVSIETMIKQASKGLA